MKAIPSLLLFLLITISPVLADIDIMTYPVGDGFSVAPGASAIELCQCASGFDSFVVRNTGRFANQFKIAVTGSSSLSISESSFELLPDQTKTIYLFFRAPCDKEVEERVTITVDDLFRNSFSFQKLFSTMKCQNLEASLVVDVELPLQPCTPVTYEVFVENTGVFTETYDVSFGGKAFAQHFGTPFQSLILPPGKMGVASTSLHLPCGMSGEFTIPFLVQAKQNGLFAELEHVLVVDPAYDFTVELSVPGQLCRDDWDEMFIIVRNDALFNNTYDLRVDGPDFLLLENTTVSLAPGAEVVVQLFAKPTDKRAGAYGFTLTVTDRTAGWSQSLSQELPLSDCFGVSINVDLQDGVRACAGYHEFPVIIKNTGLEHEDIVAWANGSYAWLDEGSFSLAPGESYVTRLIIDVPFNRSLSEDIIVSAAVTGMSLSSSDSLRVSLVDEYGCYEPLVTPSRKRVSVAEQEVLFSLTNDGLLLAEYDVRFEGPSWLGLARDAEYAVLLPGESQDLSLLLHQDESGWLGRYEGTFQLFVRSPDGEGVLEYHFPIVVQVYGKSVFVKAYEYFTMHWCQFGSVVLLFLIVISSVFLLVRPRANRKPVRNLLVVLLLLWLLAVFVFLSVNGLPPALYDAVEQDADDPLLVRVAEDTSFSLDISLFFFDPDGDLLDFTVSPMDNVSVVVVNGTATFTPDPDWAGTRRFRISAFDGNGGMAESPRMTLEVVDRPEYSCWGVYVRYCGYLNLLLLLLLLFLMVRVAMMRRKPLPPVAQKQRVVLKKAPRPFADASRKRSMKRKK